MHCLLLNTIMLSNKFAINALWFSKHCTTHIFAKLHIVLFTMNNVHVTFQLITSHMCIWQRLQIQQLLRNSQPGTCDSQGFKNLGGGKWVIIINLIHNLIKIVIKIKISYLIRPVKGILQAPMNLYQN